MKRKAKARRKGGLRLGGQRAASALEHAKQPLLFKGPQGYVCYGVAGITDGFAQGGLTQRAIGQDNRLPLAVGSGHFFDVKLASDHIADMRLAHAAHHTVNFQGGFNHGRQLLSKQ